MTRKEAKAAGLTRYIGAPCLRGHNGERSTHNGQCVACHRLGRYGMLASAASPASKKQKTQKPPPPLPVAQSDFIRTLTRAELMAGRA